MEGASCQDPAGAPHLIVDRYCRALVYGIVASRLDKMLARCSMRLTYRGCVWLAEMICRATPSVKDEIARALRWCYPQASASAIERMSVEHLAHVILNLTAFSGLMSASSERFERCFDHRELAAVLEQSQRKLVIIAASHFYSHVSSALLMELFHRHGVSACFTFALNESWERRFSRAAPKGQQGAAAIAASSTSFIARCARRLHFDFHVPINVSSPDRSHFRKLNAYLRRPRGAIVLYGDYRQAPGRRDVRFRVGAGTFFANGGLKYVIETAPQGSIVVPYRLEFTGDRFRARCGPIVRREDACARYYDEVLPTHIETGGAQWQLWFLARAVLTSML